jgi:hypothetical protein
LTYAIKFFKKTTIMRISFTLLWLITGVLFLSLSPLKAQWVEWEDETDTYLSLGTDEEEKDVVVADLNNDGLQDIIVARKAPFSNPGAREDLLLMNTGSGLEDQTALYAPEFISNPSDARDVIAVDLDGDGWLDVVFCNTFEDQPHLYMNQGENLDGDWLGFEDQSDDRLPLPLDINPLQFCAIWAGDLTGNGAPDLYFSNYNPGSASEDILLINDGDGNFTDESDARLGDLRNSAFGTSVEIHDMDNDGDLDIIKISTLYATPPWNGNGVFLMFNDGTGNFSNWQEIPSDAPYMFTVGDLNRDGFLDVYVVSDGQDIINITTAVSPDEGLSWNTVDASDPRSTGFGGNCKLADIDNDGDLDLGLCDVDVDIPPCESGNSMRKFTMGRNDSGTLVAPYGSSDNIWNESTYDFGFIDINGDCYVDLFLARCDGYYFMINQGTTTTDFTDINGETFLCDGDSLTLDAGFGFEAYEWTEGSTGREIVIYEGGEYCVTVTNGIGCTDVDCITVGFASLAPEFANDSQFCEGESLQLELTEVYTSYIWNTGATDAAIEVMESDEYCVLVTDENGCEKEVCQTVEMLSNTESVINSEICFGESVTVGGQDFDVTGTYTIETTNVAGCDSTITLNLAIADEIIFVDAVIIDDFGPGNGSIAVEMTGGAPPLSYSWDNGEETATIENLEAGDYALTVTDDFGCMLEFTFNVPLNTSTNEALKQHLDLTVQPNPFEYQLQVQLKDIEIADEKTIRVYNTQGQLIKEFAFSGNQTELTLDVPSGVYWLSVVTDQGLAGTRKVVKK